MARRPRADSLGGTIDELKQQLQAALAERDLAQAQQAAMAEVLRAINTSAGDLQPVFEKIIDNAMALCDAAFGSLLSYANDHLALLAQRNAPPAMLEYWSKPQSVDPRSVTARALRSGKARQVADLAQSDVYLRDRLAMAVASAFRSTRPRRSSCRSTSRPPARSGSRSGRRCSSGRTR